MVADSIKQMAVSIRDAYANEPGGRLMTEVVGEDHNLYALVTKSEHKMTIVFAIAVDRKTKEVRDIRSLLNNLLQ